MKEIIYATQNPAKTKKLQHVLGNGFLVKNLTEAGIKHQAKETGSSPVENARIKAEFCYKNTSLPCFAMDFGLYFDGISNDMQPGTEIKGMVIKSMDKAPTDEDILNFYKKFIDTNIITSGYWLRAFAVANESGVFHAEVKIPKRFTAVPGKLKEGFPITALQIDEHFNKYESELTEDELLVSQKKTDDVMRDFILKSL